MKIGNFFLNLIISIVRIIYAFLFVSFLGSIFVLNTLGVEHGGFEGIFSSMNIYLSLWSCLFLSALILEKKSKKWLLTPLIPLVFFILAVLAGSFHEVKNDSSSKKILPADFYYPTSSTSTEITDAEIENVTFKNNGDTFEAQIFKNIKGIPDEKIIDINNQLTNQIFKDGLSDIRNPKNRMVNADMSIERFNSYVTYVGKGIIQYYMAYEIDAEGAPHPFRDPGGLYTIFLETGGNSLLKDDMSAKVLEHFYPNGKQILAAKITEADRGDSPCYDISDFPEKFEPSFNAITREVVFGVYFPYAQVGVCQGEVEIGIPLGDILREVPQYVPKDSLLWKFAI